MGLHAGRSQWQLPCDSNHRWISHITLFRAATAKCPSPLGRMSPDDPPLSGHSPSPKLSSGIRSMESLPCTYRSGADRFSVGHPGTQRIGCGDGWEELEEQCLSLRWGFPKRGPASSDHLGDDEHLTQSVLNASVRTSGQTWAFGHGDAGPAVYAFSVDTGCEVRLAVASLRGTVGLFLLKRIQRLSARPTREEFRFWGFYPRRRTFGLPLCPSQLHEYTWIASE